MKRKHADHPGWKRIHARRFAAMRVDTPAFAGMVTLLVMDEVNTPLYSEWTPNLCLADNGYSWLQQFPDGEHHALTTMFDTRGNILQHYVDIIDNHGVDENGVPWYEDLYLDVIREPDGHVFLVDDDELEEALTAGKVTRAQYDLAWAEARRVLDRMQRGEFPLAELAPEQREMLLGRMDADESAAS